MSLICFDLDGTLVDPLEGVAACLQRACDEQGVPCPDHAAISNVIGLDLVGLFDGFPQTQSRRVLDRFHELFCEEGVFAQRVQEGAPLMLARLKRQGQRIHAVTSQPVSCAHRALHHLDLNLIFDEVTGLRPGEGWQSKEDLLARMEQEGILNTGGVLVGDRADDMRAAHSHGLRAVGVTYGYGSRAELMDARADVILDSVEALDGWLEKELKGPEIHDPFSRSE